VGYIERSQVGRRTLPHRGIVNKLYPTVGYINEEPAMLLE
jgi:hypothetical protein